MEKILMASTYGKLGDKEIAKNYIIKLIETKRTQLLEEIESIDKGSEEGYQRWLAIERELATIRISITTL